MSNFLKNCLLFIVAVFALAYTAALIIDVYLKFVRDFS